MLVKASGNNEQHTYGMPLMGTDKSYNPTSFRRGFGNHEKDDEVYGFNGSSLNMGDRFLDGLIPIPWKPDRLEKAFPNITPYNLFGNNPIITIDPDGQKIKIYYKNEKGKIRKKTYRIGEEYSGNNEFVKKAYDALNTLQKSEADINLETGTSTIKDIVDDKRVIKIKEATSPGSYFKSSESALYFDTEHGVAFLNSDGTEAGRQSPTLQFLHELGHAYRKLFFGVEPVTTKSDIPTKDEIERFKQEEQHVTEKYEWPGASKLKQFIRLKYDMKWKLFDAKDINSTEEKKKENSDPK